MKWFQLKEYAAGKKRLILSLYLYKLFGKNVLYVIAFFVSFFIFAFTPKIRNCSKKYLNIIQGKSGVKPTLFNQFRHIKSYAYSLVDKMLVFIGDFEAKNIIFNNINEERDLYADIDQKKGVFFICSHIGNVQILQSLLLEKSVEHNFGVDVFLSNIQSKIFNDFLDSIKKDFPIKVFPVQNIGLNTGVELKDELSRGNVIFIAGDRLAENNSEKVIETEMFSHKIALPKGVFRLAKLMDTSTYFICVLKDKDKYKVFLEKQNDLLEKNLSQSFSRFLERIIPSYPFQFYHFYDFFID